MNNSQKIPQQLLSSRLNQRIILLTVICLALVGLFSAGTPNGVETAKPKDAVGGYTKNGQTFWIVPGGDIDVTIAGKLTPAQLEALYPMSAADEAKIVHAIPPCPVIIDGVKYKPEDISLFNGKRLRFIAGNDGSLYAFTTPEGLEQFQIEIRPSSAVPNNYSNFYRNVLYSGESFGLLPGCGYRYLSQIGFDKAVSSAKATTAAAWSYLYEQTNYQGDSFVMPGGSNYSMLIFQGWNDRASSVYVSPY